MTTMAHSLIRSPVTEALDARGWSFEGDNRAWTLETPMGTAQLKLLEERGDFQRFKLVGGAIQGSTNARVLADNFGLGGPLKYVARKSCAPVCRVDVPNALDNALSERFIASDASLATEPMEAWANVLTECATGGFVARNTSSDPFVVRNLSFAESGNDEGNSAELKFRTTNGVVEPTFRTTNDASGFNPAAMLEEIKRLGWVGSVDEGQLNVHINTPGVFRKVRVESGTGGIRIVADLADLTGYSKPCLQAALRLAHEANARLPLVRMSTDDEHAPHVVRAEVSWGAASIPGAWLSTALEVVEGAIALSAREMAALRDPELAQLVLAAPTRP
jgi:hypothetical protein